MKVQRFLTSFCLGLAVLLGITTIGAIWHQTAKANPALNAAVSTMATGAGGNPVLGNSSVVMTISGSNTGSNYCIYNFSSGTIISGAGVTVAPSGGTTSIPCYNAYASLTITGTGLGCPTSILLGSSSSSCTYPLYTTTGGTNTQYIALPQITNPTQLFMKLTNSTTAAVVADLELIYTSLSQ